VVAGLYEVVADWEEGGRQPVAQQQQEAVESRRVETQRITPSYFTTHRYRYKS